MLVAFIATSINAQTYSLKEDFETNSKGWTEIVDKKGESLIIDGVLKIKSKRDDGFYESHCFMDYDVNNNFEIKCEVKVKSIKEDSNFGIMLDYIDNGSFIAFILFEGNAQLIKYKDGELIGSISNRIKLKNSKKNNVQLSVKNINQKLIFEVNGMKAIEARFIPMTSSGIGFYIAGNQTVAFDNLEIIQ